MAKQSWKQQMYQQIANSQVQQVMQQKNQDLQLAQSLIAQYQPNQPNNDDLALAQSLISQYQPQQTAPVQTVNAAPKQQYIPSLRQEGVNKAVERRQRFSKAENTAIKAAAKKEDQKAAFLNKLSGIGDKVNDVLLPEEVEALSAPKTEEKVMPTAKPDNAVDYSARYSAVPQVNERGRGGREWNKSVNDTLNMLNSKDMKKINAYQKLIQANEKEAAIETEQETPTINGGINQLDLSQYNLPSENGFTEQEQKSFDDYAKALAWADPNYRMTKEEQKEARRIASEGKQALAEKYPVEDKADFGKLYERMSPEDQEKYRTYDDLSLKSDPISGASVGAANKAVNMLGGALNTLAFFHPEAIPAARDYRELQKKWNEAKETTGTEDILKSATPLSENIPVLNGITPYDVGQAATQIGAYALTNSAFDEAGAALLGDKLGKLGGFIGNQIGQNAQDIALDTIPRYQELKAQGKSDEEIRDTLIEEGLWNVGGNLGLGLLGEIPGLWKSAKANSAAKRAADEVFRQNVREGALNLSELANNQLPVFKNVDGLPKQVPEKMSLTDIANTPVTDLSIAHRQIDRGVKGLDNFISVKGNDAILALNKDGQIDTVLAENPNIKRTSNSAHKLESAFLDEEANLSNQIDKYLGWDMDSNEMFDYGSTPDILTEYGVKGRRIMMSQRIFDKVTLPDKYPVYEPDYKKKRGKHGLDRTGAMKLIRALDDPAIIFKANADGDIGVVVNLSDEYNNPIFVPITIGKDGTIENINDIASASKIKSAYPRHGLANYLEKHPKDVYYIKGDVEPLSKGIWNSQLDSTSPSINIEDAGSDVNKNSVNNSGTSVPGAEPLQTFADGQNAGQWKTSKARTNTIEKLGWGDQMPEKDFAYKVYSEAEQNADAVARYKDSQDIVADILNKNYEDYDELDVKMAYNEAQRLLDQGDQQSVAQAQRLMTKNAAAQRQSGRVVQASAEFSRNTAAGALGDAVKMEEDRIINPWKSKNKKAVAGNSRIAKALAEMGHKTDVKSKPVLTHDQIKEGVIKELNREVGSVEQYFNDSDIEFLTRLAEDKSVPVWQITSEIEHKLNTGSWYTLDEGVDIPKPTNQKLQNALNSLVAEPRAEKAAPSLAQITEEVRNTLAKEFAEGDETLRLFGDDDIEYLANLINNGATRQELADALDHKMATGTFGISAKTMNQVNSIFKEISKFDPNSKQFVEGQAEAYRLLANEVVGDATALEKFEAWRYLAMLGNPKTMLRNFIGNQTFGVVTGISNNLAAMAEAGIDRASKALGGEGIQRTKSVLNPVKDSDLIKAAAEDADVSRYRQIIGSKYEKMDADTLRQSKSVFNSKILQLYEKVTDAGISDYKAVKNKFSTSLAGYLKANGYGTDIFKAEDELARLKNLGESRLLSNAEKDTIEKLTKDVAELEKARDFALKQAEYATFHEDNAVADALSRASRYLRTSDNKVLNAGGAMLEGTVPFKKTPANVLRSGLEYSPLGAIDSIKKTGKLIYENTGARKGNLADTYINKKGKEVAKTLASDVIDSWSKTLTGSGLTALGFYLYDKGILNSSDKDLQYQDQLEGKQNYSLTINGKTYTIDWAAPTAMPLLLGAEVAKVWRDSGNDVENWYEHLDEYLNAANRLADPLIETSMLQGIKDTLETAANAAKYDENLNIPTLIGYNALTGYLTQGIPTVGGQIARTIDPTRRSTYTDKEGVAGTLEKQGRKLMNKVPGLSMLNQPYIDTYGREQQNSPFDNPLANLGYQMFSPGYLADINTTDADTMSRDVYKKSGKADNILPKWYSYFKNTEGKRVSPEDFTKASRVAGDIQQSVRNELANDEWFNSLSDADKAEIVDDINTLASNVAKSSIDSEFTSSSKPYNAYKEGGLKGLMDHFKNRYASGVAEESGLNSSTKAAQAIKEDVLNGNTEAANEKIEASLSLQDLGLTKPSPTYTYYNAQTVIPGLTTEDFAKTYKAIDSDGNQGIKQDEVIAYLNSQKITSESEAKKIWSAYGSSEWKSIPKLENGKWVKKKK